MKPPHMKPIFRVSKRPGNSKSSGNVLEFFLCRKMKFLVFCPSTVVKFWVDIVLPSWLVSLQNKVEGFFLIFQLVHKNCICLFPTFCSIFLWLLFGLAGNHYILFSSHKGLLPNFALPNSYSIDYVIILIGRLLFLS